MGQMKAKLSAEWLAISVLSLAMGSAFARFPAPNPPKRAREYTFEVVRQFPHDATAFTQGLTYHAGYLYEGTGINGRSSLRQIRVETGGIVRKVDLPSEFFGEGITVFKNEVVQLTWLSHVGFLYNLSDFHLIRRFSYPGEGWGITTNGREFFMSDGTPEIRVLEPNNLAEKRRIPVHDGAASVAKLNELEFVEGEIFANVWQTDRIVRISPQTGEVVGWIDLTGLLSSVYRLGPDAVLNGIAYDAEGKRLFVTGKLWPAVFEIRIIPKQPSLRPRFQVPATPHNHR
jgi:glutaminyl-peptide cyclotransferase